MDLRDIEIFIKELREKRAYFQKIWDRDGRESNASRHLSEIDAHLKLMRKFHPDELARQEEDEKAARIQKRSEGETRRLIYSIKKISEKNLSEEEYKNELTNLIVRHLDRKIYPHVGAPPKELERTTTRTNQKFEEDKIYDLLEKVYDKRLTSFQIRNFRRNILNELGLEISDNNELVSLTLLWDKTCRRSDSYIGHFRRRLEEIGFRHDDTDWRIDIARNRNGFDLLLLIVSRTLFEIIQAFKEVEVVYEEE